MRILSICLIFSLGIYSYSYSMESDQEIWTLLPKELCASILEFLIKGEKPHLYSYSIKDIKECIIKKSRKITEYKTVCKQWQRILNSMEGTHKNICDEIIKNNPDIVRDIIYELWNMRQNEGAKSIAAIKIIINNAPQILDSKTRELRTLAHTAVSVGNIEPIKILLDKNADFFAKDAYNFTAFDNFFNSIATRNGNVLTCEEEKIAELLLKKYCDFINSGNAPVIDRLLKITLDYEIPHFPSPYRRLLIQYNEKLMGMSENHICDKSCVYRNYGSLLHYFVDKQNHTEIGIILKNQHDINGKDNNGRTPLHRAVLNNPVKSIITLLTSAGANCSIKDNNNKTPLDLYVNQLQVIHPKWVTVTHEQICTLLLPDDQQLLNEQDNNGNTCLHKIAQIKSLYQVLLDNGADNTIVNHNGETAKFLRDESKFF